MQNKEEIYEKLREVLVELFEIDAAKISMESNLYTDLDIDSIDAVDLVIKLKEITGKKIQAEEFKQVRTVSDVVETLHKLLNPETAA
ncbi:MAG: acyl carrier protein [Rhizobium sp.]|nr:MAG: acyl carrier protein [Rhizobium sp.]